MLHSAFSPQSPGWQISIHRWFTQELSNGQLLVLSHPTGSGGAVGGGSGLETGGGDGRGGW